jgi:hypothetical protein
MAESPGSLRFAAASVLVAAANALFRRERDRRRVRRREKPRPAAPRLDFDATITLHFHLRDAGLDDCRAAEAVRAVRSALCSMSGAGWISVEYVGPWADGWSWMRRAEWVTVYRRWDSVPPEGPEWGRLRGSVEETVRLALAEVADR